MNYTLTTLATTIGLLVTVASINWMVDPATIFHDSSYYGRQYADALVKSSRGLAFPAGLDPREIRPAQLERGTKYECVVIGSSHVMQVSSESKYRSFMNCSNILNAGVSGAGIEDHFALTWLALKNGKPRVLILGIDPWTFAFGKDWRWQVRYESAFHSAQEEISKLAVFKTSESGTHRKYSELISAGYLTRSIKQLLDSSRSIQEIQTVDEDFGGKRTVLLKDGSILYDSEYILTKKATAIPLGGTDYKVSGALNDPLAVGAYKKLIGWIRGKGVTPVLLMTPYHHNVWALDLSDNVKALVATEEIVRGISAELGVAVVGSFRPDIAGCATDEFYDFMRPMASCLARFTAQTEY